MRKFAKIPNPVSPTFYSRYLGLCGILVRNLLLVPATTIISPFFHIGIITKYVPFFFSVCSVYHLVQIHLSWLQSQIRKVHKVKVSSQLQIFLIYYLEIDYVTIMAYCELQTLRKALIWSIFLIFVLLSWICNNCVAVHSASCKFNGFKPYHAVFRMYCCCCCFLH